MCFSDKEFKMLGNKIQFRGGRQEELGSIITKYSHNQGLEHVLLYIGHGEAGVCIPAFVDAFYILVIQISFHNMLVAASSKRSLVGECSDFGFFGRMDETIKEIVQCFHVDCL